MKIQTRTLYRLNTEGRLTGINEGDDSGAPLLFIGKTRDSIQAYFHELAPESLVEELQDSIHDPVSISLLCRTIEQYRPIQRIWMGPAYVYSGNLLQEIEELEHVVHITGNNLYLLDMHFADLQDGVETKSPIIGYVVNGQAVSVCCSARTSDTASEASLYTAEAYRGQGLAALVVRRWCHQIHAEGRIALYSTSWDNISSQRIAQKCNFTPYGADFSIYI
ncbi:GNAT family N-acetyltransferase [Paenibacillus guangzhouensis]|uniref:GNAT family N-acetyltransferase n=1 Tax=Paenibacillus guangzhouensis TaxID=1473112 RepID=UPI00187B9A17|nr:GNAT family N-acetyltransferase [Paenibacillus guangzhouensis]